MPERTYTDAQVREILRRACERGQEGGGLSREDLIAAAQDVGIDAAAVDVAITELERESELREELAQLQQERRHELASSFGNWAIVNAGLFGIDWATGDGWWFYWPLSVWGVVLALRLKSALFTREKDDRRRAERRVQQRRRQREREQAEQRRQQQQQERRRTAGGIEGAIERGVEELLNAAARRISGVRVEAGRAPAQGGGAVRAGTRSAGAPVRPYHADLGQEPEPSPDPSQQGRARGRSSR